MSRIDVLADIVWHDTVPSTMLSALHLAQHHATEFTTVAARQQTAGRGRHGRSWLSQPDAGLFCTTLVHLSDASQPTTLSLVAGLAALRTLLEEPGLKTPPPMLKWPNDIVCEGDKLAGLLVERHTLASYPDVALVGLGINLSAPPVDDSWSSEALRPAGLRARVNMAPAVSEQHAWARRLARAWQAHLADAVKPWKVHGLKPLLKELNRHHALQNQPIAAQTASGEPLTGRVMDIGADGALEVETRTGRVRVMSGEVRQIRAQS